MSDFEKNDYEREVDLPPELQQRIIERKQRSIRRKRRKRRRRICVILSLILTGVLSIFLYKAIYQKNDVLEGTWNLDGITVYEFDGKGNGALVLPEKSYEFSYLIEEKYLKIDFADEAARDFMYIFEIENETLTMIGGEGNEDVVYTLIKVNQ